MICRRQKENRRFDKRQIKYRRQRFDRRQIEDGRFDKKQIENKKQIGYEDLINNRQKIEECIEYRLKIEDLIEDKRFDRR